MPDRFSAGRLLLTRSRWLNQSLLPLLFIGTVLLVPVIPFFTDPWIRVLFLVGLYVVLGLGLNVVVGFAGLLDLGYVAFFATGAYLMATLTSPGSPIGLSANFWLVLPLAVVLGALVGLLLGLPVLPLRGDYLAIVTLGFGEIIRLLITNVEGVTNGSQGLSAIASPDLGFREVDEPWIWYYFIVVAGLLTAFATARLRDARIGRAWEAIREDEDVAAAMGINTVKYKLMAFAIGASIGAVGGVFYASFISFINPQAFSLQVSINVLAIVIIGGMGSTPGVVIGAFILIGVPEILQFRDTADFLGHFAFLSDAINSTIDGINAISPFTIGTIPAADDWGAAIADKRFIVYGALLVAVMVLRPAGIFPSRRRQREFEHTETSS
ncbi:MAG: branched-chain amino acid ABC transporter permease [Dehalococcoidia bacterium]